MTNKFMRIIGAGALSISLITGVASAVSANDNTASKEGDKVINITPFAIQQSVLNWDLTNNTVADPHTSWTVQIGYPNINMYLKNTGSNSFRVEVKHNTKGTVIFNETIAADGIGRNYINNDSNPLVPSGTYTVTVYGGTAVPKGTVVLKASDTPW
ncbi:hypothetical protein G5B47_17910 [Paenibacillus sp. 7124]|uniref:FlgD Ig-like domain-containing protein n=2 Tax=Paenibacillus apii TaxID=1850370 RepID=A0A6M1PLE9_9BACL|nr:hypothetical protein [Paenibacillus apii]NGM84289.1 hypothetical protein [Paenibacillus apii]